MKYIKLFEEFNSNENIENICERYDIKNYTINEDGSIDVDGDVNLYDANLEKLPIKFRNVNGDFDCSVNKLKNLEGAPTNIKGSFFCYSNELTSLEGGPSFIEGNYQCYYNHLTDLKGAPNEIQKIFDCNDNKLTSLEGAPSKVGTDFICSANYSLYSLKYAPKEVGYSFNCARTNIDELSNVPRNIKSLILDDCTELKNLKGAPENLKIIAARDCNLTDILDIPYCEEYIDLSGNENLESLKGIKNTNIDILCIRNTGLKSLEYCPQNVHKKFFINGSKNIIDFNNLPNLFTAEIQLNDNLNSVFRTFEDYNLIDAFNDYNIIKAPKNKDEKPRLKLSNLNRFLKDFNKNEVSEEYLKTIKDNYEVV